MTHILTLDVTDDEMYTGQPGPHQPSCKPKETMFHTAIKALNSSQSRSTTKAQRTRAARAMPTQSCSTVQSSSGALHPHSDSCEGTQRWPLASHPFSPSAFQAFVNGLCQREQKWTFDLTVAVIYTVGLSAILRFRG